MVLYLYNSRAQGRMLPLAADRGSDQMSRVPWCACTCFLAIGSRSCVHHSDPFSTSTFLTLPRLSPSSFPSSPMTSSSSSSPEITAATSAESQQPHFSYKQATHDEVLEDLSRHALL